MATLERRDPVKLLWRRVGLMLLTVLTIAGISGVWNSYQKERSSRALRDDAQRQEGDLSQENAKLQQDLAELQTDRGKEAALRQQYNDGRPGEGLIIIVDPQQPKPIEATSTGFKALVHKFLPFW